MKKQINRTIKAYLIRGAFYLLLLGVCAIPFALAQSRSRGTAKQSLTKPNLDLYPTATGLQAPPPPAGGAASAPATPQVVLYDQYNNASPNHTRSATFTDLPTFSTDLADDFVVPGGQTWNVQSIDADGGYFFGP